MASVAAEECRDKPQGCEADADRVYGSLRRAWDVAGDSAARVVPLALTQRIRHARTNVTVFARIFGVAVRPAAIHAAEYPCLGTEFAVHQSESV